MDRINLLIKEIEKSAIEYEKKLEGNCYLYIYQDKCFEVYFARESFRHLTGVNSTVAAEDFYILAKQNKLNQYLLKMGNDDMRTCLKKAKHLSDLYKLTITDTIVVENVHAKYMEFELGITNLKLTLLLHENKFVKDRFGKINSDLYLPSSFRVGDNPMALTQTYETIDCVLQKKFEDNKYTTIVFRDDCFDMRKIPEEIKQKLSNELIENEIEYENAMDALEEIQGIGEEEQEYITKLANELYSNTSTDISQSEFISSYIENAREKGPLNIIAELKDTLKELKMEENLEIREIDSEIKVE